VQMTSGRVGPWAVSLRGAPCYRTPAQVVSVESFAQLPDSVPESANLVQQPAAEPANAETASATTNTTSLNAALPRYLQLIRKESRLRQDQADRLSREVRRINQSRQSRHGPVGERITDNTLIRVAVDLLLARAEELNGTTEDALRQSVGL